MATSGAAAAVAEPRRTRKRWIAVVAATVAILSWKNVVSLGGILSASPSSSLPSYHDNQSTAAIAQQQDGLEWGTTKETSIAPATTAPPEDKGINTTTYNTTTITSLTTSTNTTDIIGASVVQSSLGETGSTSTWDRALRAATELLYRDSPERVREYWLSQPSPRIYLYDNIDPGFSDPAGVSACVERRFLGQHHNSTWKNCPWYAREACTDEHPTTTPKQQMFLAYRYNYNTDVAYLDQFVRRLGDAHTTTDPAAADLFVVPYPHKSHCLCHKDFKMQSARCAVPLKDIQTEVLDKLEHIDDDQKGSKDPTPFERVSRRARHLFFHGADWLQEVKPFRDFTEKSMTLSLGPVLPCVAKKRKSCGHFVLPYLVADPPYQPHMLAVSTNASGNDTLLGNHDNERAYAVGAALSAPKQLAMRGRFLKHWKEWIGEEFDGRPHNIVGMGARRQGKKSRFFLNIYRNSTLCLVLPGDGCAQKRFFDALLNGCVPLVPLWPSDEKAWPHSFHHHGGCSTRIAYPFAKGSFHNEPTAGFNILDLVVAFNGTCGLECLNETVSEFLTNKSAIEEKQQNLREYASVVSLGLSQESDGYPDAFAALMVRIRHHLWSLEGKGPPRKR